jgi:hypothetical protein
MNIMSALHREPAKLALHTPSFLIIDDDEVDSEHCRRILKRALA